MGNSLIGYLKEGQPADTWSRTKQLNETAKSPDTGSWRYSIEEVKTEKANLTAVEQEYARALNTGTVDPEAYLPKYIESRKKAGIEKVNAYNQKQLDDWLKANGRKK
ncbi:hypothetical protein D3C85_1346390 [compost metagenome]